MRIFLILAAILLGMTSLATAQFVQGGKDKIKGGGFKGKPIGNQVVTIRGRISGRGVECPAIIDSSGRLYTLSGVQRGQLRPGMKVRVRGVARRFSKCMQGQTIRVQSFTQIIEK